MSRTVPAICFEVAKRFEGWRAIPYRDVAGNWTIGYGHLIESPSDPLMKATLTEYQGGELLLEDLQRAGDGIGGLLDLGLLSDSRYAALIDFAFNVGVKRFDGSTIHKLIAAGRFDDVGDQFGRWEYAGGSIVPSLERRRDVEWLLWTMDVALP